MRHGLDDELKLGREELPLQRILAIVTAGKEDMRYEVGLKLEVPVPHSVRRANEGASDGKLLDNLNTWKFERTFNGMHVRRDKQRERENSPHEESS